MANSKYGKYLRDVQVIIWDEISMVSKHAFEAVDRLMKDICNSDKIFGRKIVILSGEGKRSNEYESENESIYIPDDLICEFEEIITEIYGRQIRTEDESTHDKVILAPTKVEVIELNNKILSKGEGDTREYLSIDAVSDEDKIL
ncbi:hypothetical protein TKK_0013865 [Trichogramma kaykai]